MSLDSARARFQRRQRDLFRGEGTLERPSGTTTFDPETGQEVPDPPTFIYSGDCLARALTWEGTDVTAGGTEVRLRRIRVKLPVDTDVQHDDIWRQTASTFDESLVDAAFRVTDAFKDDFQIVRVFLAEEIT